MKCIKITGSHASVMQHVPPYIIFSDKALQEMCRRFPTTDATMRMISSVGDTKLEQSV